MGKGAKIFEPGETTSGAMSVVSRYLRTSWLWDKVRLFLTKPRLFLTKPLRATL